MSVVIAFGTGLFKFNTTHMYLCLQFLNIKNVNLISNLTTVTLFLVDLVWYYHIRCPNTYRQQVKVLQCIYASHRKHKTFLFVIDNLQVMFAFIRQVCLTNYQMTTGRHISIILGLLLNISRQEVNLLSSCLQLEMKHFLLATRFLILSLQYSLILHTRVYINYRWNTDSKGNTQKNKCSGIIIHRQVCPSTVWKIYLSTFEAIFGHIKHVAVLMCITILLCLWVGIYL